MSRKNIKSIKDCLYKTNKAEGKFQIYNVSTRCYESHENILTEKASFIRQFAMGLEIGLALSLDNFKTYCKSQGDSFVKSDLITFDTFDAFSKYTIKACLGLGGLKKVIDDVDYFFCVYRNADTGFIYGEWLPFEELKDALGITIVTKENEAKAIEKREKAQLEKLQKKYGIN